MTRPDLLRAYFLGGRSICPRAALAEHDGLVTHVVVGQALRAQLLEAFGRFAGTKDAGLGHTLVLSAEEDPLTWDQARRWAEETFIEALIACTRLAHRGWPLARVLKATEREAAMVRDRSCPRRVTLMLRQFPVICIGMGPQYPEAHPRYAPVTCLVANWMHDVGRSPTAIFDRVREAMVARTGVLYDADELWLLEAPEAGDPGEAKFLSVVVPGRPPEPPVGYRREEVAPGLFTLIGQRDRKIPRRNPPR